MKKIEYPNIFQFVLFLHSNFLLSISYVRLENVLLRTVCYFCVFVIITGNLNFWNFMNYIKYRFVTCHKKESGHHHFSLVVVKIYSIEYLINIISLPFMKVSLLSEYPNCSPPSFVEWIRMQFPVLVPLCWYW